MARVDAGAVVIGKHVLCVGWVAAAPRFVGEGCHFPGSMISLIKRNGDEAPRIGVGLVFLVVSGYDVRSEGCHAFLRLQSGVEEPHA